MTQSENSHWAELFDQAQKIISQANSKFTVLDSWSFGGGTALMLQIDHRESFDVDIFIDDPQVLPYLNPQTQGFTLDIYPDAYTFDGTHALKIVFKESERSTLSSQRT
ncbi:nucleotidyl transferase AbiEii/AbiGii toxin family protein [Rhizobium calliandrae]|uniref:Nucleotidyl transferase AbiEii/AbiGii toxin family protein n=1 Tax=Rhizobium calliandrae TaxID=1312182 RepID=A0ABT7KQ79_9HYPH|nr:nucleotidyl transferase AbiEii/AbiGii toxin family protein [Rhizobium calliandrae]MDL2410775.1 nucleotidyl transferase AbiEii/AbiGii toxin family protein [Rhizobium calliandrae]